MKDNEKRTTFIVDENTLEEAKSGLDRGDLSNELRSTVERLAHGADVAEETRLKDRLETIREDKRELRQERDQIERQLEEKSREEERIEQRLDHLRDQEGEYDGVLAMLEEDLHDGVRIIGGGEKIQKAARIGDCTTDDVIDDLKERNPDVPEDAYRRARAGEEPNWKDEHGLNGSTIA